MPTIAEPTIGTILTDEEVNHYPKAFKFSALDARIRALLGFDKKPHEASRSKDRATSAEPPILKCPVGPHADPALGPLLQMACAECKKQADHKVAFYCAGSPPCASKVSSGNFNFLKTAEIN